MQDNFYWLISITTDSARVSLVNDKIISQGQEIAWNTDENDSLLKAVDTSLSSQNSESTSNCAFVVPPTWISEDGKMFPEMLQKLKYVCSKLKLRPLGQISNDEAFVESYNTTDSFPSSYILLDFSLSHYQVSLVYLGEIKKRQIENYSGQVSIPALENVLFNLNFSSALPPKIIVTGVFTNEIVDDLRNYNWLSHKEIETFLHLPDVVTVSLLDLDQLFVDTIKKQITHEPSASPEINESDNLVNISPVVEDEPSQEEELDASLLGFTVDDSPIEVSEPEDETELPPPKPKIVLPKLSFPKFSFNYLFLLPLTLLPFLPVLPLFFATVDLTISQNPVDFSETFDVTLSPGTNVSTQSFDLSVDDSIATTGKKEVGQKASGEVTIFNKTDKSVSVNKGLIITDASGKTFETTNNILLPASTYNLDTGIINMGQVKAIITAQKIGPEFNLATNVNLTAKDNSNLLVKTSTAFSGGSREEKSVVTQADRNNLLESAKLKLKEKANSEINSQKSPQNTILDSTMNYQNQKTVFNREVGEEADSLTLNLNSKVSFLYFNLSQKQEMIQNLFPKKESLSILDKNTAIVNLSYSNNKLTLSGKASPLIDNASLKSKLTGKKESDLKSILNSVPKYYQHNLTNSLWFLNLLKILPVKTDLINIIVKN